MQYVDQHALEPDVSFDGGDMDCGSGLLLLIRRHMDPLRVGGLLEIRSTESSVEEDLPGWCRMTKNELVSCVQTDFEWHFLVCKGTLADREPTSVPRSRTREGLLNLSPLGLVPVVPATLHYSQTSGYFQRGFAALWLTESMPQPGDSCDSESAIAGVSVRPLG